MCDGLHSVKHCYSTQTPSGIMIPKESLLPSEPRRLSTQLWLQLAAGWETGAVEAS
jgi:hypothetical protein